MNVDQTKAPSETVPAGNHMTGLKAAAFQLAQEIWDKKWDHVADIKTKPVPECAEIIDELRRRCPGHPIEEYKRAIADGLHDSR